MLKTQIVQPLYHSNHRTEFRVRSRGKVLMPNMRLCNFGVSEITANGAAGQDAFAFAGGCLSLIKNIVLYSGNIILDQITDADQWLGISNMASQCDEAYELKQKLLCSNLNLDVFEDDDRRHYIDLQEITTKLIGRVNLQDVFPFLKSTAVVGKGQIEALDMLTDFEDLRLVVEYHQDPRHIFIARDIAANTGRPTAWKVSQPEIVYEELVDEEMVKEAMKGAPNRFLVEAVERERIDLAAVGSTRLRGFDGKQVSNLVIQYIPGGNPEAQLGYAYSTLQPGEKIQIVVNGKKLLPFQGADLPARKAAMFADAVGPFLAFTGTTDSNIYNSRAAGAANLYTPRAAGVIGDLSFMAVNVLDVISQMELEYQAAVGATFPAQIWVWATVLKYVSKDPSTGLLQTGYVAK